MKTKGHKAWTTAIEVHSWAKLKYLYGPVQTGLNLEL